MGRMSLVRTLARPMLASMFVVGGADEVRHAAALAPAAQPVTDRVTPLITERVPPSVPLPSDAQGWVRLNGSIKVVAGLMLATGRLPRLSALVLAGSLAPTTFAGHRFWQEQDPQAQTHQRHQFFKNLSMFGGLVLAAVDVEATARERVELTARRVKRAVTSSS